MSKLAKQEENGKSGESLTQSILLSRFWVLKRSADIDGADYLLQRQCDSLEELRARASSIETLGIVQSKYFENSNRVSVQKAYVLENDKPRKEFFCSLHTHDQEGENRHYFFSAEDIVKEFELTSCGEIYWFALTKDRQYTEYRNPKNRFILDKIESGMRQAEGIANKGFLQKHFSMFASPTMHFKSVPDFQYGLTIIDGVRVVTITDKETNSKRLLEQRRDLYANQGDFFWGDDDIGCQFLAVSILAHHFGGNLPSDAPVLALREELQALEADSHHVIDSETIRCLLNNKVHPSKFLLELETKYPINSATGDIAFFEVMRILDAKVTVRCANGIESVVDTSNCDPHILHMLNGAKTILFGIECSFEPICQTVAIRLLVERDEKTKEVVRILYAYDVHKIG